MDYNNNYQHHSSASTQTTCVGEKEHRAIKDIPLSPSSLSWRPRKPAGTQSELPHHSSMRSHGCPDMPAMNERNGSHLHIKVPLEVPPLPCCPAVLLETRAGAIEKLSSGTEDDDEDDAHSVSQRKVEPKRRVCGHRLLGR